MPRNFSDSFYLCVAVFRNAGQICAAVPGPISAIEEAFEHLGYLCGRLTSGIPEEVFELIGKESDNFVLLVNQMPEDDRYAVLENVFDQLTDRIDDFHDNRRIHKVKTNPNDIHLYEAVLTSLLKSLGAEKPLRIDFKMQGKTFSFRDWTGMKADILLKSAER